MDAQAKKKALFRARLNAQKQEKQRIDSPLVRYNEHDQPVCRICDVVIKSDSLWPAHQASRKHHEAIKTYKVNALKVNATALATKSESAKDFPKPKPESSRDLIDKSEPSTTLRIHQPSTLPSDFFDNHDQKRQKNERDSSHYRDSSSHMKDSVSANTQVSGSGTDRSTTGPSTQTRNPEVQVSKDSKKVSGTATNLDSKQVKGELPAGFFDDKDSDLRARGIKPVKPDVKDEYKEFEKLIQEDLQEIDNRLEEEEFVAAEVIEEEETVEQRAYIERVEMLRKKKLELRDSRSAAVFAKDTEVMRKKSSREDSSSDEDDDDFKVDWRAKRL
ncbi:zinc finger protein 830 [Phtheirospermum japonicum]|uniref:Zinc finger protein 830 n=1 Tax=Phtheirospermum japonicum TaxID=374723 RepID=A0A830CCZ5_9LAMI|nr:zinc finger protein 830 [Phtheirospermum japonicum]